MTEQWFIFRDRETGQELGGYTMQGTFPGERAATIELIAAEKGIPAERIETIVETRTRNADPYSMEQWRQDGDRYTIILNSNDTPARQYAAFLHEVTHIYCGDLEAGGSAEATESRTHRQLLEALEILKQEGKT